ncbi:MAG: 30S ribosome-binding factor RbfA [Dehalococcoidales bacterium]|jgi:ribosome-binding factor A|nr:30S ribosome-binding factor RbfA [Dehalococcoidales bacterium]
MSHRIERVNQLIRQEISHLLLRQIKDPRLGNFLSVNQVETAADLKHARVYVSCICSEEEKQQIMSSLESAAGYLHNELARRIRMRYVPTLTFYWDSSIERAAHIMSLIDRVSKPEEQV